MPGIQKKCTHCGKQMRSDNLKRHEKTHKIDHALLDINNSNKVIQDNTNLEHKHPQTRLYSSKFLNLMINGTDIDINIPHSPTEIDLNDSNEEFEEESEIKDDLYKLVKSNPEIKNLCNRFKVLHHELKKCGNKKYIPILHDIIESLKYKLPLSDEDYKIMYDAVDTSS